MNNRYSWLIKLAFGSALVMAVLICQPGSWERKAGAQAKSGRASDPMMGTSFQVEVEGRFKVFFSACSGIGSSHEIIEHKMAQKGAKEPTIQKIPGRLKWNDVTLSRGLSGDMNLQVWRQDVIDGKMDQARKKCTITMLDRSAKAAATWDLLNAWPSGLIVNQTAAGEQVVEEMTITYESAVRSQ